LSVRTFLEKGEKPEKGRRTRELRFSAKTKVRVSLTYNSIKPVIHMIISNKCRDSLDDLGIRLKVVN